MGAALRAAAAAVAAAARSSRRVRRGRRARDGQGPGRALPVGRRPRPRRARRGRAARVAAEPERMVARGAAAPERADASRASRRGGRRSTRRRARHRPPPPRRAPAVGRRVLAAAGVAGDPRRGWRSWPLRRRRPAARRRRRPVAGRGAPRRLGDDGRPRRADDPHVGDRPNGIALAGGDLWVTSYERRAAHADRRRDGPRAPPTSRGRATASRHRGGDGARVGRVSAARTRWCACDARTGRVTQRLPRAAAARRRWPPDATDLWVAGRAAAGGARTCCCTTTGAARAQAANRRPDGVAAIALGGGALWASERDHPRAAAPRPAHGRARGRVAASTRRASAISLRRRLRSG